MSTAGPSSLRVGRRIEKYSASVAPGLKQLIVILGLENRYRSKERTIQDILSIFYLFVYLFYTMSYTVPMTLHTFTYLNLLNSLRQIFFLLLLNLFYCGKSTEHEINPLHEFSDGQY